jgi:hypothetical protein
LRGFTGLSRINHKQKKSIASGASGTTGAGVSRYPGREQARQAVTKAKEAVKLLERARKLMTEENPAQLAMEHLHAALREAESRATVSEDWYQRSSLPSDREGA